ncbi:hypothetical protein NC652_005681 [Populus alba x Populus x berolinensis]|uniref:Uncharacterized protein n=1 Tax=Populus alba x Populus x berolinensis TaxID=444605 RepID=A0AAD6WDD1_9ROSI|nr:hypothetical protein NC652_005681 [Populus alba x Populus x berolinensis]KAJ7006384.1 hypothetical protein NC653_005664 [Populus alba x Populus x berolinensis]
MLTSRKRTQYKSDCAISFCSGAGPFLSLL